MATWKIGRRRDQMVSMLVPLWQKDPHRALRIEREAERLGDPIERLKFLRQATSYGPAPEPRHRGGRAACFLMLAALICLRSDANVHRPFATAVAPVSRPAPAGEAPNVWIVEETRDYETYSNGLRIENRYAVANEPRSYPLLGRDPNTAGHRSQPAGIVFHSTESPQAPFAADQRRNLQRIGKELLLYVRSKRAYHYVIDRFGTVHRIVIESDAANHAGNSVWADDRWIYLDLNASFLAVAFESSVQSGQPTLNPSQTHAARVLTEMLRSKYNLAAENCVTHAQVSVNPDNMHIGWHSDWGKDFPFREVGLPDNYRLPPPSMWLFGFEYDPVYQAATGPPVWAALAVAEERLRTDAAAHKLPFGEYRASLRRHYRARFNATHPPRPASEN